MAGRQVNIVFFNKACPIRSSQSDDVFCALPILYLLNICLLIFLYLEDVPKLFLGKWDLLFSKQLLIEIRSQVQAKWAAKSQSSISGIAYFPSFARIIMRQSLLKYMWCISQVQDVRKCQRWFLKFGSSNFDLTDSSWSGRSVTSDNDMLRAEVEANPCHTEEKLSSTNNHLNRPTISIYARLTKYAEQVFWYPTIPFTTTSVRMTYVCTRKEALNS